MEISIHKYVFMATLSCSEQFNIIEASSMAIRRSISNKVKNIFSNFSSDLEFHRMNFIVFGGLLVYFFSIPVNQKGRCFEREALSCSIIEPKGELVAEFLFMCGEGDTADDCQ